MRHHHNELTRMSTLSNDMLMLTCCYAIVQKVRRLVQLSVRMQSDNLAHTHTQLNMRATMLKLARCYGSLHGVQGYTVPVSGHATG